ncbi:RNA exonuclease 4 isoform X2 [Prorops nasuta]
MTDITKHNDQFATTTKRCLSGSNWKNFKTSTTIKKKENSDEKSKMKGNIRNSKRSRKTNGVSVGREAVSMEIYNTLPEKIRTSITKQIALDCEMVGIGDGTDSMIARVSIVNRYGHCLYDKYVKPREKVKDYRTAVSGIRPHHLENGEEFSVVQKEVSDILKGHILVGHALKHDLDVLFLSHPYRSLRDTSRYKRFRQICNGRTPSLKRLVHELLGEEIQIGEHNSVEDARAAMKLYSLFKNEWESSIYSKER